MALALGSGWGLINVRSFEVISSRARVRKFRTTRDHVQVRERELQILKRAGVVLGFRNKLTSLCTLDSLTMG